MKTYNLFLLAILFIGIFNKSAFSQEQNCEEAKRKYLIRNGTNYTGLDAWVHFKMYGKKAGCRWNDYEISSQCYKSDYNDSIILAETVKITQSIGVKSNITNNYFIMENLHQELDFYDEPLSVLDTTVDASLGGQFAKAEKEKLENLLKGYLELQRQDSILTEKLKKYSDTLDSKFINNLIEYQNYKKSKQIIDLSKDESWIAVQEKLREFSNKKLSGHFIILTRLHDPNFEKNADLESCKQILLKYYEDTKNSPARSYPGPQKKEEVEDCLLCFRGQYNKYKDKIKYLQGEQLGSQKVYWLINRTEEYFTKDKINTHYYYLAKINDSLPLSKNGGNDFINFNKLFSDPNKVLKIINKTIQNNPSLIFPENEKQKFIEYITGIDELYYQYISEKTKIQDQLDILKKNIFIKLPQKFNNGGIFTFIGNSSKGIPSGFGYLINEKKQLIAAGYWDEGFPIVLYNVNLYQNPEKNGTDYVYFGDAFSKKHANRYLYTNSHGYQGQNVSTFEMYIGQYIYTSNENANKYNGYGSFFYSDMDKNIRQYFTGMFSKSNRHGKGKFVSNTQIHEGNWVDGKLNFGTITSKVDKSVYTGQIKDWQMHGEGKKVYTNGKVEEGIFENGTYRMTKSQYIAEQKRKEQERIAEERIREELRLAEERRQNEIRIAKEKQDREEAEKLLNMILNASKEQENSGKNGKGCSYCSNPVKGKGYLYKYDKNTGRCSIETDEYCVGAYNQKVKGILFCTPKCAIEGCKNGF